MKTVEERRQEHINRAKRRGDFRYFKQSVELDELNAMLIGQTLELTFETRDGYLHKIIITCVERNMGDAIFTLDLVQKFKYYSGVDINGRKRKYFTFHIMNMFGVPPSVRKLRDIIREIKRKVETI